MNKLCFFFVLASASYALAAVERYESKDKPEEFADREGCYVPETNEVYPYDTPVYPEDGSCSQFLCSKSTNETQKFTCGAIDMKDGCETVIDTNQLYPGCCPQQQCDPTTPAPTTVTPSTTPSTPTTPAPTTVTPSTTPSTPTTPAPTTVTPSTTPSTPTTPAPTTVTPSTTPSTPTTPPAAPGSSYASAFAQSEPGKPPVTQTNATPGASAAAAAS